jgi:alginate O-acetyltransferase complex protein AlgI
MTFAQIEFFVLLAIVLTGYLALPNFRARKLLLLATSLYFYAYWDWRFLGLMLASITLNYLLGIALGSATNRRVRDALLWTGVAISLGTLCVFKYYNFFIISSQGLLQMIGWNVQTLNVILPIGISFYTFHALSYTIDVYRGELEPTYDPFDFALFITFFPVLVAGPIVRASHFLPQLRTPRVLTWDGAFLGFRQFTFGFFKKVLLADTLGSYVDAVFVQAGSYDASTTWLAVISYAVQIYCDFSGYSDMAIGTARIFGFEFPENFNRPYLSRRIDEFWRRWHISLSSWLRDYLYVPLGGNRRGRTRTYINLMLTMLIGGLWHGAAWTFVFWGGVHGLALTVQRFIDEYRGGKRPAQGLLRSLLGWATTMLIVLIGWVFFRAPDFHHAMLMLQQMFWPAPGFHWIQPAVVYVLLLCVAVTFLHLTNIRWFEARRPDSLATPVILSSLLLLSIVFRPQNFQPFIYFQF